MVHAGLSQLLELWKVLMLLLMVALSNFLNNNWSTAHTMAIMVAMVVGWTMPSNTFKQMESLLDPTIHTLLQTKLAPIIQPLLQLISAVTLMLLKMTQKL